MLVVWMSRGSCKLSVAVGLLHRHICEVYLYGGSGLIADYAVFYRLFEEGEGAVQFLTGPQRKLKPSMEALALLHTMLLFSGLIGRG